MSTTYTHRFSLNASFMKTQIMSSDLRLELGLLHLRQHAKRSQILDRSCELTGDHRNGL